jgi:hypothetical protein
MLRTTQGHLVPTNNVQAAATLTLLAEIGKVSQHELNNVCQSSLFHSSTCDLQQRRGYVQDVNLSKTALERLNGEELEVTCCAGSDVNPGESKGQ